MCYKPLTLRNPLMDEHRTGFDPVHVQVPCGKCTPCRRKRSNDWILRGYFELQQHNFKNIYFVTLDYDNNHLPLYDIEKHSLVSHDSSLVVRPSSTRIPCFNMEDVKAFFARLRYYIGSFRYMFSCDYGGMLHRPHYHLILIPSSSLLSDVLVHQSIQKCWICGTHEDITTLSSVDGNRLKALSYVCEYVTKDITFDLVNYEKDLPLRHRYQIHASKGFGLSAIDYGYITYEDILLGKRFSLPLGKNGSLVHFNIPRYYEMKFCYDYSWDRANQKASLVKNEKGVKLSESRHNANYVMDIRSFFSSRHIYHDFLGHEWYSQVCDCLSDIQDFREYMYLRPFIQYHVSSNFVFNLYGESYTLDRPRWSAYESIYGHYLKYVKLINKDKYILDQQEQFKKARFRALAKVKNNPRKLAYLKYKGVV